MRTGTPKPNPGTNICCQRKMLVSFFSTSRGTSKTSSLPVQIDEAFADSQAPNAAAIKNARGVVLKRKLVGLFRSTDGTLLFGDCKGSGAENYRPSADFADPGKPVYRCTCPSHQFPCKHSLALLFAYAQGSKFAEQEVPTARGKKEGGSGQTAEGQHLSA